MTNMMDPAVVQAVRQADAGWAAVREAQAAVYWSVAGVIVNSVLAFLALAIPAWQRRMMKHDNAELTERSRKRFIHALGAVADAQTAVVKATTLSNPEAGPAFARAELLLRGASQALTQASAAALPISAIMISITAQHNAAKTLAHYPDLKNYGANLLFYGTLLEELEGYAAETQSLLDQAKSFGPWEK